MFPPCLPPALADDDDDHGCVLMFSAAAAAAAAQVAANGDPLVQQAYTGVQQYAGIGAAAAAAAAAAAGGVSPLLLVDVPPSSPPHTCTPITSHTLGSIVVPSLPPYCRPLLFGAAEPHPLLPSSIAAIILTYVTWFNVSSFLARPIAGMTVQSRSV